MIGKIGRYEILGTLGEGSMGIVYKAHDTIIERIVAIKTVKVSNKANRVERFYHEAKVAGKLTHPNIAMIYDIGEDNSTHFLVFEYVKGKTMKDVLTSGADIPLLEKLHILVLISRTLHYAHQRGVIHRDVKPANIMLIADKQVKIMDFGIAVFAASEVSCEERCLGTPYYMAPEQIKGAPVDRTSDIYSLGAVSYEFLTGTKPFLADGIDHLFEKIQKEEPLPPHILNSAISEDVSSYILKALQKQKEQRYQAASEYADVLEFYINRAEIDLSSVPMAAVDFDKKQLVETLKRRYTFFADFSDSELLLIFNISGKKSYKKGDIIFKEDTIGDKLFIIITGKVRITKIFPNDTEETFLASLGQGDCFGEMAIMDSSPRFATAIAQSDCVLIAISEVILRTSEPTLCLKLYKNLAAVLSEKLRRSDTKINELWTKLKQFDSVAIKK
ncbi:MAG: protein kinase [Nitrospirae bacterium]|nr:protein kinase [Nitrospirota bacterium]MBF0536567.1 protein kinase [Nitrospirota bacterium]MBF0618463.1 protein kinase [Nitrospirota bacterium]